MDPAGQWNGEGALGRGDEYGDGLEGMAHDELGLGVGVRLLMKQLDGGHFPASLWDLDPVANEDESPAYAQDAGEVPEDDLSP